MPYFHYRPFLRSFRYAGRGLRYAYRHEQNFRVQVLASIIVLLLIGVLHVSTQHAIILILVVVGVLALELLNTTLEKFIDVVKPRIHYLVEVIKDLMAAAVLLMSLGALVIGLLIFLPYVLAWFR